MSGPTSAATSFMESRLSLLRMHWDHEPRLNGRCRASVLDCGSPLPLLRPRAGCESARGLAQSKISRCDGRFMESRESFILCNRALLRFSFVNGQDVVGPFRGLEFRRPRSAVDRVAGLECVGGYFVDRGQLSAGRGGDIHRSGIAPFDDFECALVLAVVRLQEILVPFHLEFD